MADIHDCVCQQIFITKPQCETCIRSSLERNMISSRKQKESDISIPTPGFFSPLKYLQSQFQFKLIKPFIASILSSIIIYSGTRKPFFFLQVYNVYIYGISSIFLIYININLWWFEDEQVTLSDSPDTEDTTDTQSFKGSMKSFSMSHGGSTKSNGGSTRSKNGDVFMLHVRKEQTGNE